MSASDQNAKTGEDEWGSPLLRHAFEVWFKPEIKRRREAGTLPEGFTLFSGQVLMEPGKPPVIRLNDEVRGVIRAQAASDTRLPIEKNAVLRLDELGDIVGMQLTVDEPNAGHVTAIYHRGAWWVMFDFRYNAERIGHNLEVARQFLACAEEAVERNHHNAAVDNLFSCVELTAKSYLMIHPDERLLQRHSHGFVGTEFNQYAGKLGNADPAFVKLLNTLTNLRPRARYPDEPLTVSVPTIREWIATAKAMLADLETRRPQRFKSSS